MNTQHAIRSNDPRRSLGLAVGLFLSAVCLAGCGGIAGGPAAGEGDSKTSAVPVVSIAVSPDGRTIACCNRSNTLTLRDRETLKTSRVLKLADRMPMVAKFHPRGNSLLVGYYDGGVALWDLKAAAAPVLLGTHDGDVRSAAFSNDGRTAVTGDGNGDVIQWNIAARTRGYRVLRHSTAVWSLAFSRDDRLIASGGTDGMIRMWDSATGRPLRILAGHDGPVRSLDVSRDGSLLVSGGLDSSVRVWNFERGRALWKVQSPGNGVVAAVLSHDASTIASATVFSGDIQLWDVQTRTLKSTIPAHETMTNDLAFMRDGTLISCGMDGEVQTWLTSNNRRRNGSGQHAALSFRLPHRSALPERPLMVE